METSLAKREMNVPEIMDVAKAFSASGYFKDARDAAQAAVKIMAGQELGIPPVAAMTGIAIVKEKVALGANLIAGLIKGSGKYNYRVTKHTDSECVIEFTEHGKLVGTSSFSMTDAKKANLSGVNWTQYPRNMLFARALTNGAKWYCPDATAGIAMYTPEELGDTGDDDVPQVDTATGEVIEAEVVAAEPEPAPAPKTDPDACKRTQLKDAIYTDWNARAELDGVFAAAKRRKNSVVGFLKQRWPAIETADMTDVGAVVWWLDNAPLADLTEYGKHNRKRLTAEREAVGAS